MRRKYLKKITVAFRFKLQVLNKEEFKGIDDQKKVELWRMYLKSLAKAYLISDYQAETWKYPEKELNS